MLGFDSPDQRRTTSTTLFAAGLVLMLRLGTCTPTAQPAEVIDWTTPAQQDRRDQRVVLEIARDRSRSRCPATLDESPNSWKARRKRKRRKRKEQLFYKSARENHMIKLPFDSSKTITVHAMDPPQRFGVRATRTPLARRCVGRSSSSPAPTVRSRSVDALATR